MKDSVKDNELFSKLERKWWKKFYLLIPQLQLRDSNMLGDRGNIPS
jgi:hypothetical protein